MAQKIIQIPEIGDVVLQKRKGSRSIKLSIAADGSVKVSMPSWSPYHVAEAFVKSKVDWITRQQVSKQKHVFVAAERIGKAHRIRFIHEDRPNVTSRITNREIIVRLPLDVPTDHITAQEAVQKAAVRSLKQEAKQLLPGRLQELASKYEFTYASVSIKRLKTRWGSCTSQKDITLNCYLMQLPWDLIDYVILHELTHTRIMAHGPVFWEELGKYVHNLPEKRKTMRTHQPMLVAQE